MEELARLKEQQLHSAKQKERLEAVKVVVSRLFPMWNFPHSENVKACMTSIKAKKVTIDSLWGRNVLNL